MGVTDKDCGPRPLSTRSAGPDHPPAASADEVVRTARAGRGRVATVAAVTALAVAGGVAAVLRLTDPPPRPASAVAASPAATVLVALDEDRLARLGERIGSPDVAGRIVAAGTAADESIVALAREHGARPGKAAQIWIARGAGRYEMKTDYIGYDDGCPVGDLVCAEVRPTGLGFYVTRLRPDGRTFVLVQAPPGRTVDVVVPGATVPVGPAPHGAAVEVDTPDPWEVEVHVTLPDGRRYRLAVPVGSVLRG